MNYIIGREGNQPFVITDEFVSRQHAVFSYDENTGVMTLIDKSKPGVGTFVKMGNHFQQVYQCTVDANTVVRLGPYYVFKIAQLFQKRPESGNVNQTEKEKKEDISHLRDVAENYEETKLKLEQKQANINSLRGLTLATTLAGAAIGAIIPKLLSNGQESEWYLSLIGPVIALALMAFLMIYCNQASKNIIREKNQNEKKYKLSFKCPNCGRSFVGKLYENLIAEGKCPKCNIQYYDSKI